MKKKFLFALFFSVFSFKIQSSESIEFCYKSDSFYSYARMDKAQLTGFLLEEKSEARHYSLESTEELDSYLEAIDEKLNEICENDKFQLARLLILSQKNYRIFLYLIILNFLVSART